MALALTATPETSPAGVPRVRLTVTGASGEVWLYRHDPNGAAVGVRQASPAVVVGSGPVTVWDYEAPLDEPVTYTAQSGAESARTPEVVSPSDGVPWLVHPGMPDRAVPLRVLEWPTWSHPITRGVHTVIGRYGRVVVSSRRHSPEGSLIIWTDGGTEYAALRALLSDGSPLLIRGTATDRAGSRWVSVGDVEEEPTEIDLREWVVWTLPLIEVDAPAGFTLAAITYADTAAEFFSYGHASVVAPTYAARASGEWRTA